MKNRGQLSGGFWCTHCRHFVVLHAYMGTANRNHCNLCLWSKHVDSKTGDRQAGCRGKMRPVGLTFKHEGVAKIGELMLIHECLGCSKISINRLAADDQNEEVISVFELSCTMTAESRLCLIRQGINVLDETQAGSVHRQLFGDQSVTYLTEY